MAIINKNFATLDNEAATASFKIVMEGLIAIPDLTLNTGGAQYGLTQVEAVLTHDLGYQPVVVGTSEGGGLVPSTTISSVAVGAFAMTAINITVTDTQVIFFRDGFGYNYNATISGLNIKYYLLQKAAI